MPNHTFLSIISSYSDRQFDLLKIITEKGALALIIALSGIVGAILIERYKSVLLKNQEMSKIIMPRVLEIMEDVESLFNCGQETLSTLNKAYPAFVSWGKELLNYTVLIGKEENIPTNKECKDFLLKKSDGSEISFFDLLVGATNDQLIYYILTKNDFWEDKFIYEKGNGLISSLSTFYRLSLEERAHPDTHVNFQMDHIIYFAIPNFFSHFMDEKRSQYNENLNKMNQKIMRTFYSTKRKQIKIHKVINLCLDLARESINKFPVNDVINTTGKDISASKQLLTSYTGLLSQLHKYLRTV